MQKVGAACITNAGGNMGHQERVKAGGTNRLSQIAWFPIARDHATHLGTAKCTTHDSGQWAMSAPADISGVEIFRSAFGKCDGAATSTSNRSPAVNGRWNIGWSWSKCWVASYIQMNRFIIGMETARTTDPKILNFGLDGSRPDSALRTRSRGPKSFSLIIVLSKSCRATGPSRHG